MDRITNWMGHGVVICGAIYLAAHLAVWALR